MLLIPAYCFHSFNNTVRLQLKLLILSILKGTVVLILLTIGLHPVFTQTVQPQYISLNDAVKLMLTNNPHAKNARLKVEISRVNKGTALEFGPTEISYYYGQLNAGINDNYFEVNQNFGSPLAHYYKGKLNKEELKHANTLCQITLNELTSYLKSAWFEWVFAQNKLALVETELSVFEENMKETFPDTIPAGPNMLNLTMVQTRYADLQRRKFEAGEDYKLATNQIKQLLFTTENIAPTDTTLEMYAIKPKTAGPDKFYPATQINFYNEHLSISKWEANYERAKLFPEISGGYFNQQINQMKGFEGIALGITVPLWFLPQKAKIKQAAIQQKIAQNELDYHTFSLEMKIENLKIKLDQLFVDISFYSENALKQAEMIEHSAVEQYKANTLPLNEFLDQIGNAYNTRLGFLETVKKYNLTAIELEYLVN